MRTRLLHDRNLLPPRVRVQSLNMGSLGSSVHWFCRQSVNTRVVGNTRYIIVGGYPLRAGQLVVHGRGVYGSWLADEDAAAEVCYEGTGSVFRASYA
jgi:hypothetical protein